MLTVGDGRDINDVVILHYEKKTIRSIHSDNNAYTSGPVTIEIIQSQSNFRPTFVDGHLDLNNDCKR